LSSKTALKRMLKLLIGMTLLALTATVVLAQETPHLTRAERADHPSRTIPGLIAGARLDTPVRQEHADLAARRLNPELRYATGRLQVVVQLNEPSVSEATAAPSVSKGEARQAIFAQQEGIVNTARAADNAVTVLARTQVVLNAVILEVDASVLPALAANPNVISINPVRDYEMDLSETVPYIGALAVQDAGFDGSGIKVAVLDSGIDYTHGALGGSGDPDDYDSIDPTTLDGVSFPTAKVIGGYDFVGSTWPSGPLAPDPNPIDDGPEAGHGTHVADIIGGVNGVAPGVDLYAVKVCSSVSTACSGIALIQGMEFAVDPDGDGDPSDRVHVINMSLGANYGDPRWDDLSAAVDNASALGVLTVVSAGNSNDKPYAHGTPASAPTALAVAQTNVPSATQALMEVTEPAGIAGQYAAVFQSWSAELTERIEGPLQYGDGEGGNLLGCDPFAPGSLDDKIVLVDRGDCNFTLKIKNIGEAGGLIGIIGLVAPGDPFDGGDGGDRPIDIPGYMISQTVSNRLKSEVENGVTIVFDPDDGIPLVMHMVGSSSRGPSIGLNQAKPDIGAPGGSVSAVAGSGDGVAPFGGTSGAAPMVSGSAALLMQARPDRSWAEIKAVLMNTGETDIMNTPAFFGGGLASISRIGGGEVRVDRALVSPLAAWDRVALTGSLSFGFHDIPDHLDMVKRVVIKNYSHRPVTLRSEVTYRNANDDTVVVRLNAPSWFSVPARGSVTVPVYMFVRPFPKRLLHDWVMNSGSQGANPATLTLNEYDGYITFRGVGTAYEDVAIHMPWHVLPRGAGDVFTSVNLNGRQFARNLGRSDTFIDTYSLLGTSEQQPAPLPGMAEAPADLRYFGVQTYPVPAGFCSADESFVMSFAVNSWDRQTLVNQIEYDLYLDTNEDGNPDYVVFNFDLSLSGQLSDGRNVTWVLDLNTSEAEAFFFTYHPTNSANTVLTICAEQIGMNAEDFFVTSMKADLYAFDWYNRNIAVDAIEGMNIVPLGERYLTVFGNDDVVYTELPSRSPALRFDVLDFGAQLNATETGLLWLYGPGAPEHNEAKVWIFQQ
jgi:minor extracellular serine protease Vpr